MQKPYGSYNMVSNPIVPVGSIMKRVLVLYESKREFFMQFIVNAVGMIGAVRAKRREKGIFDTMVITYQTIHIANIEG